MYKLELIYKNAWDKTCVQTAWLYAEPGDFKPSELDGDILLLETTQIRNEMRDFVLDSFCFIGGMDRTIIKTPKIQENLPGSPLFNAIINHLEKSCDTYSDFVKFASKVMSDEIYTNVKN